MIKSEGARPNAWVYINLATSDVGGFVARARQVFAEQVEIPTGYTVTWSGQYSDVVPPAGGFATLCGMGMLCWCPAAAKDQFPATPGTSLPAIQTDSIVRLLPMSSAGFAV